jgi:hypothetical protein
MSILFVNNETMTQHTDSTKEGEENASQQLEEQAHHDEHHNKDIPPAPSPSFHAQNR